MKQIGPVPEGLAVWLKTSSSMSLPDGSARHRLLGAEDRGGRAQVDDVGDGIEDRRDKEEARAALVRERWREIQDWFSSLF